MFFIDDTGVTMIRTAYKILVKGGSEESRKKLSPRGGNIPVRTHLDYILTFWIDVSQGRDSWRVLRPNEPSGSIKCADSS
jgi:hypothetical protein